MPDQVWTRCQSRKMNGCQAIRAGKPGLEGCAPPAASTIQGKTGQRTRSTGSMGVKNESRREPIPIAPGFCQRLSSMHVHITRAGSKQLRSPIFTPRPADVTFIIPSKNKNTQTPEGIGFRSSDRGYFLGLPRLRFMGSSGPLLQGASATGSAGRILVNVTSKPIFCSREVSLRAARSGLRRSK